jgi:hypothetical protein
VVSQTRFLKQQKIKHMDTLSIIAVIAAFAAVGGLAWLGGYELGQANGITTERQSANRRINGVLDSLNNRKPKTQRGKRKAARKAARV